MTEAHKGLMTSKELGMAVADRLLQSEKRPETPRSEPTTKQQAHRQRMLQPPTREERVDGHVAPALKQPQPALPTLEGQAQHSQKDLSAAPAPVNPDNHNATQAFGVDPAELREVPFYVLLDRVLSQGHDPHSFLRSLGLKPYSFLLTQDPSRRDTFGTREHFDFDRAREGLPPMTDEQWKEWEDLERRREEFDRLPPGVKPGLLKQWYETHVLPDSKRLDRMTFWEVIGEVLVSLLRPSNEPDPPPVPH